jgi:hypothetical protein
VAEIKEAVIFSIVPSNLSVAGAILRLAVVLLNKTQLKSTVK